MSEKKEISLFTDNVNITTLLMERYKVARVFKPDEADVVVFGGGIDVGPKKYGEEIGHFTNSNDTRDETDTNIFNKTVGKALLLGVSRGAQLLTVLGGGKLFQYVTGHQNTDHDVFFTKASSEYGADPHVKCESYSIHKQMMNPYVMALCKDENKINNDNYKILAYTDNLSAAYMNGDDKMVNVYEEYGDGFIEPEIVYYPWTHSLCIQGHPERDVKSNYSRNVLNIIEKLLNDKDGKKQ